VWVQSRIEHPAGSGRAAPVEHAPVQDSNPILGMDGPRAGSDGRAGWMVAAQGNNPFILEGELMAFCAAFGIDVPDSFPLTAWESFYGVGRLATDGQSEPQGDFIRAMGCVVYRYKTCRESIDSMIAHWNACGHSLTLDAHYTMQRDLFSFLACGLSAVESLFYACYVVATQKHPQVLDWSNQGARKRKADPDKIAATLTAAYPVGHPLINEVNSLTGSQEWKDWNAYRNTMVHRSLPSRLVEASIGGPPPLNEMIKYANTWSNRELRADESQMEAKLDWLAVQLERISTAAATL
jgi:hypothetical protein